MEISPLISFSILLFVGSLGGYLAHRLKWLPSITGFMLVGLLIGPSGLGLLSEHVIKESRILIDIALGLILYRLGLSINLRYLQQKSWLVFATLIESLLTFAAVFAVMHSLQMPNVVSALIAAIFVSSSPAVLLHVSHEMGAKGDVTESSESLVALNNMISFVAFVAVQPWVYQSEGADWKTMIFHPFYRLFGSFLLGALIGYVLHLATLKTVSATQYRFAFVVSAVMLSVGLAAEFSLSTLVVPLSAGLLVRNLGHHTKNAAVDFGEPFEIFFIVLFVYAGAGLHLKELLHFAPAVFALVFARSLAKIFGVSLTALFAKQAPRAAFSRSLLLIPMAGLAIGLVQTTSQIFPQYAATVSSLVLGAVAIFETIGPPIAAFAFRFCGEAGHPVTQPDSASEATMT